MVDAASRDQLDPALKRDLFFGDLALTRRHVITGLAGVVLLSLSTRFCLYAGDDWHRVAWTTNAVACLALAAQGW